MEPRSHGATDARVERVGNKGEPTSLITYRMAPRTRDNEAFDSRDDDGQLAVGLLDLELSVSLILHFTEGFIFSK